DGLGRATYPVVILDCLTLLLTGAIFAGDEGSPGLPDPDGLGEAQVEARAQQAVDELLGTAACRAGRLIVVTNELGMGIVPEYPLGRWFRDAQGRANQRVAAAADQVVFMVSGIPWTLKGSPDS
ncbi:MAG: bifunctional adenosylcobinamide kinase/adenosylcobinamide-phosphate guanylyltransferase, partial [Gemmatimonadales bacterium]